MYAIQKESYGYYLTFGGFIPKEEMRQWLEDCRQELTGTLDEFVVFVDMRNLNPLEKETQELMKLGQRLFKEKGMKRSVVVVDKPIVNLQFEKIAKETGIYAQERYLDLVTSPNWEELGLNWILHGIEPTT